MYIKSLADSTFSGAYGIGRSLVALGLLLTVSIDGSSILFAPDDTRFPMGRCGTGEILDQTLFCVFGFEAGRWIAVLTFLLVVFGAFPALTAIPFAYAAWSLQATLAIPEGGDQLASNLAIIMMPIGLLDWRWNQWMKRGISFDRFMQWPQFGSGVRFTGLIVIWIQMSIVYFFAAVEKLAVDEWLEGTAIYYWASDPNFGAVGIRQQIFSLFTNSPWFVVLITWGTLLLEFMLAFGWLSQGRTKRGLMIAGIIFHLGIALIMGLVSFSIIMSGALILYLGVVKSSKFNNRLKGDRFRNCETELVAH
ncbi:sporulation-delaying protein SdpB family protein [Corynebacterium belfantii]|uniref:HTTM domain-containing protein n=1 Tax=Corynebacterium belfantii TaxID=2014537 RepID=A0ABS0LHE1_9CORY|nr:sporulation-delaying protein SdpB family protein [Corynebacterium belfantii]SPJ42066.1 Sporulation-delaying protein SdpB [Corynebacterium diphtheriae subsp. lausannense]STC68055.1 antimicrobial peptide system protein, SdpB family [Corynebacterium diphtheriae]MBG9328995.1 HTTM domain-containing protein [Corynebacterium belfantii]MBG9331562.1 HTTM domain-containing protein [Corynebacterium belfantii]MBG9334497.1 HTTM domain-containing protein [Corynebacterium belfantii]